MAASRELMTAYLSLELLSFSLYILVSYQKFDARSNEAGLKYLLLGAFASAMFLYGMSLIYGVTGSTYYSEIAASLSGGTSEIEWALLMGLVLIVTGLGFKVAAVPFHMWTPDAYEGASSRSRRTSRRRRRRRALRCCWCCSPRRSRWSRTTGRG